jgi:ubiquinone/menaquinone biosynthesis C-methylase UbiE
VALNPPGQYADDRNLNARQRLWRCQVPSFELTSWVLDLAGLAPGMAVLDAGCGNGLYLRALLDRGIRAVGCDVSLGMLRGIPGSAVLNAEVTALPVRDGAFDLVLAGHLLDLVPDRSRAVASSCAARWHPAVPAWRSPPAPSTCGRCAP